MNSWCSLSDDTQIVLQVVTVVTDENEKGNNCANKEHLPVYLSAAATVKPTFSELHVMDPLSGTLGFLFQAESFLLLR